MISENFKRFGLEPFLLEALDAQGFSKPTEIQERLIPAIINGKDVIGQSHTGTGKTLSFFLPILQVIKPERQELQAIVTAPTRELATQLFNELRLLTDHTEEGKAIVSQLLVGGTDKTRSIEKLKNQPHIVVGTAGRISDLIKEKALKAYSAEILVVDEADQMLDMGFIDDVDHTASHMAQNLQMLVFSATIPEKLQPFLKKYMNDPRHVKVDPEQATAGKIEHQLLPLRHRDRLKVIVEAAQAINPFLAVIFTNTKDQADEVSQALLDAGLNTERIHGGLQPRERKQIMKKVRENKIQYLVATDLAARGIDIKGITHVINYDLPKDLDFYVHRTGRTARAGMSGIAITFYSDGDQQSIERLVKKGISFKYVDFKKGEWMTLDKPPVGLGRSPVRKQETSGSKKAVAKPKKVKPAYKKKARYRQAKEEQRQRRVKSRTKK
ncbi:DEAD/DEAH box helicase [Alkalicoccobacillus murimartini]|uniref:ATP-dependent RNA helicase CshB n=1 Tax=Alkalicoccobacillus murimartini TaxID=171685 RepID=A0ABT9YCM3_9BACI|nr:DEAD/DEAH box helicase [Alkalicoccobacillus murimartini]MDQ0205562.1 ATP-dependent RNA helicase CshB [Alkalicoccobacillus murimartini]